MIKFHCQVCGIFLAQIVEGSKIRKGAVMLCEFCSDELTDAKNVFENKLSSNGDIPDFLANLFKIKK